MNIHKNARLTPKGREILRELYRKVPKFLELTRLRHYIVKTRRRT